MKDKKKNKMLYVNEKLLKAAEDAGLQGKLGKIFEEALAAELDTSRELERLKTKRDKYYRKYIIYKERVEACELLLQSKIGNMKDKDNLKKAVEIIIHNVIKTKKPDFPYRISDTWLTELSEKYHVDPGVLSLEVKKRIYEHDEEAIIEFIP